MITMHSMPQSAKEGAYNALTQYNRIEAKVKNPNKYRKEIFE